MTEDTGMDMKVEKPVGHTAVITAMSMDRKQMRRQLFPYYLSTSYSS